MLRVTGPLLRTVLPIEARCFPCADFLATAMPNSAFHVLADVQYDVFVCRAGSLYGELARFIFRMLGIRTKAKEAQLQPNGQKPGAPPGQPRTNPLPGLPGAPTHRPTPQSAGGTNWDNVWAP